jgi:hypothetical protein
LTLYEEQTHFALWSFAKSPLFISLDFEDFPPEILQIVTNPSMIALNQDSAGNMPKCILNCMTDNEVEIFKVNAVDNGTYTSVLAVNWDS